MLPSRAENRISNCGALRPRLMLCKLIVNYYWIFFSQIIYNLKLLLFWWFFFPFVRSDVSIDRRMNNLFRWFSYFSGCSMYIQWSGSTDPAWSLIGVLFMDSNRRISKFNRHLSLNFAIYSAIEQSLLSSASSRHIFHARCSRSIWDRQRLANGRHGWSADGKSQQRRTLRTRLGSKIKIFTDKFPRFWTCKFVDLRRIHIVEHISISTAGPPKKKWNT